jgi:hypothetical protein
MNKNKSLAEVVEVGNIWINNCINISLIAWIKEIQNQTRAKQSNGKCLDRNLLKFGVLKIMDYGRTL